MLIKPLKQIIARIDPTTGKEVAPKVEKQYLVLIHYLDTDNEATEKSYEIIRGRIETAKFLLNELENIDLLQSHVIAQNLSLEKALTVYSFLRLCLEKYLSEEEQMKYEIDVETLNEHMENFYEVTSESLEETYQEEINQPL